MKKDKKEAKDGKGIKIVILIVVGFDFFYHAIYFLNLEGSWLPFSQFYIILLFIYLYAFY